MRTNGEGYDCENRFFRMARKGFQHREDGSLTIFSLFMFILILMIAGTAVDMIRHERERVKLQNTLDTAVLAASGVSQSMTPEAVVKDYVSKAGLDPDGVQISSSVNYTGAAITSRSVSASSPVSIDTMFMDMMGVDSLSSLSRTNAKEGETKLEIALVLDISGSMNWASADATKTKMEAMKKAAKEFVHTILDANDPDNVAITIIPYNHQVAVPANIMSQLSLSGTTKTVAPPSPYTGALTQYETANADSNCLVFDAADYQTRGLTASAKANRSARFLEDRFYWALNGVVQQSFQTPYEWAMWCNKTQAQIFPYSNDESDLKNYIDGLSAGGATAINMGLNWGVAMVDPGFSGVVQGMVTNGDVPAELAIFPTQYNNPDGQKYIVVMTDGENTDQFDLDTPFKSGPSRVWFAPSKTSGGSNPHDGYYVLMPNKPSTQRFYRPRSPTSTWDDQYISASSLPSDAVQLDYHEVYERFGVRSAARFFFQHSDSQAYNDHYNATVQSGYGNADTNTVEICNKAKENSYITIYTVAFEAPSGGADLLKDCATAPGYYFDVDGTQISDAFSAIANQIALLRLTE